VQKDLTGDIIRAEKATQLYRDTTYKDLISFEEDIARIASMVLVITESPGSFAELGAFATNATIRSVLRVIMQTRYYNENSFIRFGPIELIMSEGRGLVGIYPWRTNNDHVIIRSVAPDYIEIVAFINKHLNSTPASTLFPEDTDLRIFYVIYWLIFILYAVSTTTLHRCVSHLLPGTQSANIINKLYCMELAGWIKKFSYSDKDYYFTASDEDPFKYSFRPGTSDRDSIRRKADVTRAMESIEVPPRAVLSAAAAGRKPK